MDKNRFSFSFKELQNITDGILKNIQASSELISKITSNSRNDCSNSLFIALPGETFDGHSFIEQAIKNGAIALCLQKNQYSYQQIPDNIPVLEVENTLSAYQSIAKYHRLRLHNLTLIALTGSNGKTSTKDVLNEMLCSEFGKDRVYATQGNTNNHLGVPLNLLGLNSNHRYAIIEMGTNHPGEIATLASIAKPDIAIITSIGPAHLEFLTDLNGVAKEKSTIFSSFKDPKNAIAIIPAHGPANDILKTATKAFKTMTFGETLNADIQCKYESSNLDGSRFELIWNKLKERHSVHWSLFGKHQAINASSAAAAATAIGIAPEHIAKHLTNSKITGMRMRLKRNNGIIWINDAYNANPESVEAGIKWLAEIKQESFKRILVVLGDMFELGENSIAKHKSIIESALKKLPRANIITVGSNMEKAASSINLDFAPEINKRLTSFPDTDEAIQALEKELKDGDMIYLKASRKTALEKIEEAFVK